MRPGEIPRHPADLPLQLAFIRRRSARVSDYSSPRTIARLALLGAVGAERRRRLRGLLAHELALRFLLGLRSLGSLRLGLDRGAVSRGADPLGEHPRGAG